MSHDTPASLLKLAASLQKIGTDLAAVGATLAAAAASLEQEAANVAWANAQRWGVDVQVAVRAGPPHGFGQQGQGTGGGEVVVNGVKK
ncbi:phytanoyl- dioxygenase [Pyrenophora seminiperda CCB06]|uniref:Phytanoyl-dioxygenase n=1 Tax=Pyrenophora seminiperda CCB06 TaxID=1302712 RepID=A0A3M7M0N0_9PLEO|nr:phytanoyl- dioxygenase [Pyrenophora seminiperda CCB06]